MLPFRFLSYSPRIDKSRGSIKMEGHLSRRRMLRSLGAAALPAFAKTGNVEIGVCGSIENFEKAEKYGFDYYEPAVAALATLSDQDFSNFSKRVLASRLRCKRFNSFIRTLVVVGPKVDK